MEFRKSPASSSFPTKTGSALRRDLTLALVLWHKGLSPETMSRLFSCLEEVVIDRTAAYLVDLHDLADWAPSPSGRRIVSGLVDFQTEKLAEYKII
ncbi:MAG: hypothetical protein OSB69_11065 [Alphaproteobacteria bacterium]|nr:hypothetical protein [Alphaproteobacteria bacterium]